MSRVSFSPDLFRVGSRRSILDGKRRHFMPGEPLDGAAMTEAQLQSHIATGDAVRKGATIRDEPAQQSVQPVKLHNAPVGDAGIKTAASTTATRPDDLKGLVAQTEAEVETQRARSAATQKNDNTNPRTVEQNLVQAGQKTGRVKQAQSPWEFDPASLKGKTVDQLNVTIGERDPNQPPMNTAEEAIAFLSQDFRK